MIFHITLLEQWQTSQQEGQYQPVSYMEEGFIHAAKFEQVISVANAFYQGQHNLALLTIDPQKLNAEVKWEAPIHPQPTLSSQIDSHQVFPHIYGVINLDAVVDVVPLICDQDGTFNVINSAELA